LARGAWTIIGWGDAVFAERCSACVGAAIAARRIARRRAGRGRVAGLSAPLACAIAVARKAERTIAITSAPIGRVEAGA
jgi:hypothetical protein